MERHKYKHKFKELTKNQKLKVIRSARHKVKTAYLSSNPRNCMCTKNLTGSGKGITIYVCDALSEAIKLIGKPCGFGGQRSYSELRIYLPEYITMEDKWRKENKIGHCSDIGWWYDEDRESRNEFLNELEAFVSNDS